jgi:hypothetical protein
MHHMILAIEGWDNPNHVRNVVEKFGEDNQKAGKIN